MANWRTRKWPSVLIALDTLAGTVTGVSVWVIDAGADSMQAVAIAAAAVAVALIAALATIVTLVSTLASAEVLQPVLERMGGRERMMFPFWFHGYVGAAAILVGLLAAVSTGEMQRVLTSVAVGLASWVSVAIVDLARQAWVMAGWKERLTGAVKNVRRSA